MRGETEQFPIHKWNPPSQFTPFEVDSPSLLWLMHAWRAVMSGWQTARCPPSQSAPV